MTYLVGVTTSAVLKVDSISHAVSPRQVTLDGMTVMSARRGSQLLLAPAAKTMGASSRSQWQIVSPPEITMQLTSQRGFIYLSNTFLSPPASYL